MKYTIYLITNKTNGKTYIGKHQTLNPNDGYFGSGNGIKAAIAKYGKKAFTKEVIFIFDNEHDMNEKERELLTEDFVARSDNYNAGVGGEGGAHFKGKTHTKETKKKISDAAKKRTHSKETRAKISNGNRKRGPVSDETRKKISDAAKKRYESKEARNKISEGLKKYYQIDAGIQGTVEAHNL